MHGWKKLRSSHPAAPDVGMQSTLFTSWSVENAAVLQRYAQIHGARAVGTSAALDRSAWIGRARTAFGLLQDLLHLWLMANESTAYVAALLQGARALGDHDLERDLSGIETRNERQRTWLLARIRQAAPQTLTVPS